MYRPQLLWIGEPPPDSVLKLSKSTSWTIRPIAGFSDILAPDAELIRSRSLVVSIKTISEIEIIPPKSPTFDQFLAHGLSVSILCPLDLVPKVGDRLRNLEFASRILIRSDQALEMMLNEMYLKQIGLAASYDLTIKGVDNLELEDEILIRRSFSDCKEVELRRPEGEYGANVYQAFAKLRDSRVGPAPLPFFVKLDRYPKIERELENYRDCTALFIPFYSRPNIESSRCFLGATRGIIVGNFVENSETLSVHVEKGTAQNSIASLFDDTLRGWRTQAFFANQNVVSKNIAQSLGGTIPTSYSTRAKRRLFQCWKEAQKLGAKKSPSELAKSLDMLPVTQHRCARAHGDLHGDNVCVRGANVILIDFASAAHQPLVCDPAHLDISLAFRSKHANESEWKATVLDLYFFDNVDRLPEPRDQLLPMANTWNSIRQIRRYGLSDQMSAREYASAVCIFLLRRCLKKPRTAIEGSRQVVAYLLAEQLSERLSLGN